MYGSNLFYKAKIKHLQFWFIAVLRIHFLVNKGLTFNICNLQNNFPIYSVDRFKFFTHKYFGRDIENLLSQVKRCHSRRVFTLNKDKKTIITIEDLKNGPDLKLMEQKFDEI